MASGRIAKKRVKPDKAKAGSDDLRVSVRVHSDLRFVDLFHTLLTQVGKEVSLDPERADWVALALREAVNNAILHGNAGKCGRWVEVEMERRGADLFIRVFDEGPGLSEAELEDPRKSENIFKPHGRGIFLIRQFVDGVRFLRDRPGLFGIEMRVALLSRIGSSSAGSERS